MPGDVAEVEVDPLVRDQLRREQSAKEARRDSISLIARQVAVFVVFLVVCGLAYTAYKGLGEALDDGQRDWPVVGSIMPRSDDLNMPPIGEIFAEFGNVPNGSDVALWRTLITEGLFTLREAAVGFLVGVIIGLLLAVLLVRSRWLERGLTPYIIASQTVPLVAIAPLVVIWGRQSLGFLPWEWKDWMSVAIIAAYLTFFPVAINGLRGLKSPKPENLELMQSYAAGWTPTLWRLRLPASVPYLFAAFKIAASASVVGAIVGEISANVRGGLGRRIFAEAQSYTTAPGRLYASVLGAAVLGIAVFLLITAIEHIVLTAQGRKAIT